MKTSLLKLAGGLLVASAFSVSALALPITGEIHIDATGGSTVALNFVNNTVKFSPTSPANFNAKVSFVDGDYAAPSLIGDLAKYSDFNYGASPGAIAPITIWSVPGLASFVLNDVTSITEIPGVGLLLEGSGIAYLKGYDPTPGDWSFSANRSKTKFTFASTTTPESVPDTGATAALLVLGFVGVRAFRPRAIA